MARLGEPRTRPIAPVRNGPIVRSALSLQSGAEPFPGYRLCQQIGSGGYAEVWASTSPTGQSVALKFMRTDDTHAAAQEVWAIQSLKQLRHPNLLRLDQVWTVPGYIVISMELADGSLHDLLQASFGEYGTAVLPDLACRYLGQIARAIDFLNARQHQIDGKRLGFQHCDVKPSNMLLVGDQAKLADFGMAVPMVAARVQRAPLGTVEFAAPEVFQGELTDKSDQFSLAVSYCVVRGGRLPFAKVPDSFRTGKNRSTPDLGRLAEIERPIVARALNPTPQDRWENCSAMMDALADLYGFPHAGTSYSRTPVTTNY